MITLLVILYVAFLAVMIHKGKLPNTVLTWSTTLIWAALLMFVLFFPMKIGAPGGEARIITYSVAIVPNVAGTVTEVVAEPNTPLKEGDVLFKLDDQPFKLALAAQEAQLANAKQGVEQLEVALKAAKVTVRQAAIARDQAKQVYDRYAEANTRDTRPYSEEQVETARLTFEGAKAALEKATVGREAAEAALGAQVDGVNATVVALTAQVETAKYNLEQTVVRAPSDGQVTAVALRVGQRITSSPATPAMNFIESSENIVSMQIGQIYHRHIRVGHEAEVLFKTRPGHTYSGKVVGLVQTTALGEASPNGVVPVAQQLRTLPFFVRIELDDKDAARLIPAGSIGQGAVYTDALTFVHPIQRVTVRMNGFMNYLVP